MSLIDKIIDNRAAIERACTIIVVVTVVTMLLVVCLARSEPATLESLAWQRVDTAAVWQPQRTAWTDTLERLDSIIKVRQERTR